MFDKLRRTSSDSSKRDPSTETSSTQGSRAPSTSSSAGRRKSSAPGEETRRSPSRGGTAAPSAPAKSRWRDILWRSSMWNQKGEQPQGPKVRAMSQSVDVTHPEIAEERMRASDPWRV